MATSLAVQSMTRAVTASSRRRQSLPTGRGDCRFFAATDSRCASCGLTDAPALLALLTSEEVTRFISPPPTTLEGFERFIEWTEARTRGGPLCVLRRRSRRVRHGRRLVPGAAARSDVRDGGMGFCDCVGEFWGSGLFSKGARLVVEFAFDVVGAHRLEARSAVENGRGNGALQKIGAVQEGILRKSFLRRGNVSRSGTVGHHRRGLVSIEGRVGREGQLGANPVRDPRLVIVRRGHFATFELLTRTFADDPSVQIMWDRRMGDRRQSPDGQRQTRAPSQRPPPCASHAVGPDELHDRDRSVDVAESTNLPIW